jgi:hypothetical protein
MEIKIYYLLQQGTKITMNEHFSFRTKHDSNRFKHVISSLHLSKYVMNGRAILSCGTQGGDILVYYIDWDETDPNYGPNLKKRIEATNSRLVASGEKPVEHVYHSLMFPAFSFYSRGPISMAKGIVGESADH